MKKNRYIYLLMIGHACVDVGQGALPAMLPFLILQNNLTYAQAASLVFASNVVSCISQPILGHLGDRVAKPWFMSAGLILSGSGMAAVGFLSDYKLIFTAIAVSGFGVALFHPEGAKIANIIAGDKKASGMSIFTVGGNAGFSVGPILISAAIMLFGMKGACVFLIPSVAMAVILILKTRIFRGIVADEREIKTTFGEKTEKDDWKSFFKVLHVLFAQSILGYGFTIFIPIFWVSVLRRTVEEGNLMLSLSAGVGIVAMLIGGVISEKYGYKNVILVCAIAAVPLYMIFSWSRVLLIEIVVIMSVSLIKSGPRSTLIAMAQSFTPNRIGLSSGFTLGLGTTIGGMTAPVFGLIGDLFGIPAVMHTITGMAVLTIVFAALLPKAPGAPGAESCGGGHASPPPQEGPSQIRTVYFLTVTQSM